MVLLRLKRRKIPNAMNVSKATNKRLPKTAATGTPNAENIPAIASGAMNAIDSLVSCFGILCVLSKSNE
jgi:hypothetical protein